MAVVKILWHFVLIGLVVAQDSSMIFGEGHVMTFDGHIYEFPGYQDAECTYVLASNFVDRNFTLLTKQLSTTLVLTTCTVEIDQYGLFFINGSPTPQSPPFVAPNEEVIVTRDGPWVNVTTTHGIELQCHEGHFMCVYRLSGWYYAKTRGLLGNLDTEHVNEFIKPDGIIVNTLIDFVNSYEVTGMSKCQIRANFELPHQDPSCFTADQNTIKEKCLAIFYSRESFLVPIYDAINPEPFLQTCLEMAEKCMATEEIVNPYITLGRIERIFLEIPGCADPSRVESCNYTRPAVTTSDIIFVISEHYNMLTGVTEEELKQHIKDLYVPIRVQYPDSKFAVVAYGGPEYEHCAPHLHSNEMESFKTSYDFDRAVDSLDFCEDDSRCTCSPSKGDALKAVRYASDLLLRENAGHIFILIDNNEQEYDESTRLAVADSLANNSVIFNVISKYSELEKTIGKVPIIGVNYDGSVLFNKRDSAENITEVLDTPKGTYAKLSTATGGAMFGINYLKDGNTDLQPVLKKLLKTQIGNYAAKTNIVCKSIWDIYGRPSSKCYEV